MIFPRARCASLCFGLLALLVWVAPGRALADEGTPGAGLAGILIYVTPTSTPAPGTPLPLAWWRLDDGRGSTALDSTPTGGHHGALRGSASWSAAGVSNGALTFDGEGARVLVPPSAALQPPDALTLTAWVNPDASGLNSAGLLVGLDAGRIGLWLGAGGAVTFRAPLARGDFTGPGLRASAWQHVAVVYDRFVNGGQVRLYLNGERAATFDGVGGPLVYAGGGALLGADLAGALDEVGVYAVALSDAQVAALYATPSGPLPLPVSSAAEEPAPTAVLAPTAQSIIAFVQHLLAPSTPSPTPPTATPVPPTVIPLPATALPAPQSGNETSLPQPDIEVMLAGVVFDDRNGNGIREPDEPGLARRRITLVAIGAGQPALETETDADGRWSVLADANARYLISFVEERGWLLSTAASVIVDASGGAMRSIDFGMYHPSLSWLPLSLLLGLLIAWLLALLLDRRSGAVQGLAHDVETFQQRYRRLRERRHAIADR